MQQTPRISSSHTARKSRGSPRQIRATSSRCCTHSNSRSTLEQAGYCCDLKAAKLIMRPERETEEHRDPCLGQTDSRYAEGPLWEPGPAPENASPNRRAAAQKCSGDDY